MVQYTYRKVTSFCGLVWLIIADWPKNAKFCIPAIYNISYTHYNRIEIANPVPFLYTNTCSTRKCLLSQNCRKCCHFTLDCQLNLNFSHEQKQGGHKQNPHKVSTESTTDSAQANFASKNICSYHNYTEIHNT